MSPFPLALNEIFSTSWGVYAVYLLIGFAFGYVLEIAGFANSRTLAAQFYFKDITVLKVMFGAIAVAMVLVFLASGLGWLDYNLVWVNPTYLWPGIVGGLIMGVGFIVGGFCPGTSLVSAAVLKLDGIFFALGVFFGIFLFGETVGFYEEFWYSSYMGRYTLPELFNTSTGVIVVAVIIMALFLFWGGEHLERIFGQRDLSQEPKWRYGSAGILFVGALLVFFVGQPTTEDKWASLAPVENDNLANREWQAHPMEVLEKMHDTSLHVMLLDVRSEADYNLFHLVDAQHAPLTDLPAMLPDLRAQPANTLIILMSNDEEAATQAWQTLRAESVANVYILEGGINGWLSYFADDDFLTTQVRTAVQPDQLRYTFPAALGSNYTWAEPDPHHYEDVAFIPKIKLELKRGPSGGGCG